MHKLFDLIPVLENEHLVIRKLRNEDAGGLRDMVRDPEVYRYLPTFLFELKYEDPLEVIEKLYTEGFAAGELLILGVFLKDDPLKNRSESFCGLAEFYGYKDHPHQICVGLRLRKEFWGRGIAAQSLSLMADYLFFQTDIEIITACTMAENKASEHVLAEIGFRMSAARVPEDWGYETPTEEDKWFLQKEDYSACIPL